MLILSRRVDESVYIGAARVLIVEYHGNQVRLGIDAPSYINVRRFELPPICTCEKRGTCEIHGCRCATVRTETIGDEVRTWCPRHNVTTSTKIGEKSLR